MIRKTMLDLLFLSLSAHLVFADVEIASYTSYGAEVKRDGSETWEFIKPKQKLNAADLLRIPPDMNLHVKVNNDDIKLPQGQEGSVESLIQEAKQRKEPKHGNGPSSETQILETDSDASRTKDTDTQNRGKEMREPLELDLLRALASVDESTLKAILGETEEPSDDQYPYRNKGYAEKIFNRLQQEIQFKNEKAESDDKLRAPQEIWESKTADETEFAILYLALLKGLKIKADFRQNNKGEILVLFDSGRSAKQVKQITANRDLYRFDADGVWLPLQVSPLNKNWVQSWYRGGTALRSE